jgi:peptide/nickel transport system substrate-binding protein
MKKQVTLFAFFLALAVLTVAVGCRPKRNTFVLATADSLVTLDPMGGAAVDVGSERLRQLMFNSLVRKNERFEYVGELAQDIQRAPDGLSVTFQLRDGVQFHDGRPLTSADAKYTLDTLLAANVQKTASFFEGTGAARQPYITRVEAPDAKTLIVRLRKPWLPLLANLVPIGIIPNGSAGQQKDHPLGSGPFAFVAFNLVQQTLDLKANEHYWEGAPKVPTLRVVSLKDSSSLQAELLAGRVDCAPAPSNLTSDAIATLGNNAALKAEQFPGANLAYIGFNTKIAPLNDARFRQAVAYAIDRERIIRDLLLGQAKIAHSVLPAESWAYSAGQTYAFDPAKAKQLLDDLGMKDPDGDGPQMRLAKPIVMKLSGGSTSTSRNATTIQDYLKQVGIPLTLEPVEGNTLTDQQVKGEYQMIIRQFIGGNQDPIFLRDLFATSGIPPAGGTGFNRTRYSNPELDPILESAINTADPAKAKELYAQAQAIVSRDLPLLPLWYPSTMVLARKTVGNISIKADGDWSFARNLTVQ